jgi:hypothetical protein
MSAEAAVAAAAALARQRRVGLRVALAIAAGFTFEVWTGAVFPFMAPLFALQFLIFGAGPLSLAKAIAQVVLVVVVGLNFIVLTAFLGDRPVQLLTALGLFFFFCFFLQARGKGGPAIFLALMAAIVVCVLDPVQANLDSNIIIELLRGILGGVLLSWLAHLVLPSADAGDEEVQPAAPVGRPMRRAVANAIILLGSVTLCLTNHAFATATVLPITVASLLLQFTFATDLRSALGLVAVNLLGGVVASVAFALVELRPSLLLLFLTILLVGSIMAGRAMARPGLAPMYAGGLTTFLIMFGIGISPLPMTAPESFATRIGFVLVAVVYTLCMTSLLWSRDQPAPAQRPA